MYEEDPKVPDIYTVYIYFFWGGQGEDYAGLLNYFIFIKLHVTSKDRQDFRGRLKGLCAFVCMQQASCNLLTP